MYPNHIETPTGFGLEITREKGYKVIIFYAVLTSINIIKEIQNHAGVNIPLKHEKTHLIVEAILHSLDIKHSSFTAIGEILTITIQLIIEGKGIYNSLSKVDIKTRLTLEIFIEIIKTIKDDMPELFARMKEFLDNDNAKFFVAITNKEKQKLKQSLGFLKDKLEDELSKQ